MSNHFLPTQKRANETPSFVSAASLGRGLQECIYQAPIFWNEDMENLGG